MILSLATPEYIKLTISKCLCFSCVIQEIAWLRLIDYALQLSNNTCVLSLVIIQMSDLVRFSVRRRFNKYQQ